MDYCSILTAIRYCNNRSRFLEVGLDGPGHFCKSFGSPVQLFKVFAARVDMGCNFLPNPGSLQLSLSKLLYHFKTKQYPDIAHEWNHRAVEL